MDVVNTEGAFRYVMSKFGDLILEAKTNLEELQSETREIIHEMKEVEDIPLVCTERNVCSVPCKTELNKIKCGESEIDSYLLAAVEKNIEEKNVGKLAMHNVHEKLTALEKTGGTAWLQPLLYLSDYRPTLRVSPRADCENPRMKIPVYDIVFPINKESVESDIVLGTDMLQKQLLKEIYKMTSTQWTFLCIYYTYRDKIKS